MNVDLDANQHGPGDHLLRFIDDKTDVSTGKGGNGFIGLLHFHIGEDLPFEGLVARVVVANGGTHHIDLGAAGIAVILSASFGITRILLANLLFQLGNAACIFGPLSFVLGTIGFTLCILLCHTRFVQILFGPALCVDRIDTRTKSLHTAFVVEVLPIIGIGRFVDVREDLRVRSLQHLIRCLQTRIDVLHVEIGQRGHCCGCFLQSSILLRSLLFRNSLGFGIGRTALPLAEFLTALFNQLQTFVDDLDVTTILLHERFGVGDGRTVEPNLEFALGSSLLILLVLSLVPVEVLRVLALQFVELCLQRTKFGQVGTREDLVLRDRLQREHDRVDGSFHVSFVERIGTLQHVINLRIFILQTVVLIFFHPVMIHRTIKDLSHDVLIRHIQDVFIIELITGSLAKEAPEIQFLPGLHILLLHDLGNRIHRSRLEHIVQRYGLRDGLNEIGAVLARTFPAFHEELLRSLHIGIRRIHPTGGLLKRIHQTKNLAHCDAGTTADAEVLVELGKILLNGSLVIGMNAVERHQANAGDHKGRIGLLQHTRDHCNFIGRCLIDYNGRKIKNRVRTIGRNRPNAIPGQIEVELLIQLVVFRDVQGGQQRKNLSNHCALLLS